MAFRDFTFPKVKDDLGLTFRDADLFSATPAVPVRPEFATMIRYGVKLASAISTEKAKSEFIIAPILLELWQRCGERFCLFSGVDWDVDSERGLNGYCDFLLTHGESQLILSTPFVAVVE